MTLAEAKQLARELATQSGQALEDYLYILQETLEINPAEMNLYSSRELSSQQKDIVLDYWAKRGNGIPAQYILGYAYFYGRCYSVNPSCLIPRPDTEGLAELALQRIKPGSTVLDIGTGSGAIAITICLEAPESIVTASDISEAALISASANAQSLGAKLSFHKADLFPNTSSNYDLIISNPPYISPSDYDKLPVHIRLNEPKNALYAAEEGLYYYRRILEAARQYLNPGGQILFEIGSNQADAIKSIAKKLDYAFVEIRQDLAGLDRYIIIDRD